MMPTLSVHLGEVYVSSKSSVTPASMGSSVVQHFPSTVATGRQKNIPSNSVKLKKFMHTLCCTAYHLVNHCQQHSVFAMIVSAHDQILWLTPILHASGTNLNILLDTLLSSVYIILNAYTTVEEDRPQSYPHSEGAAPDPVPSFQHDRIQSSGLQQFGCTQTCRWTDHVRKALNRFTGLWRTIVSFKQPS